MPGNWKGNGFVRWSTFRLGYRLLKSTGQRRGNWVIWNLRLAFRAAPRIARQVARALRTPRVRDSGATRLPLPDKVAIGRIFNVCPRIEPGNVLRQLVITVVHVNELALTVSQNTFPSSGCFRNIRRQSIYQSK